MEYCFRCERQQGEWHRGMNGKMRVGDKEYTPREDYLMFSEEKRDRNLPSVEQAKKKFLQQAISCPLCKTPPEELSWVYLVIPRWACKNADENEGWITICDRCKLQIDFFVEKK
jgi:hypothetical protein